MYISRSPTTTYLHPRGPPPTRTKGPTYLIFHTKCNRFGLFSFRCISHFIQYFFYFQKSYSLRKSIVPFLYICVKWLFRRNARMWKKNRNCPHSPPPVYSSQTRGTYRTYPGIVLTSTSLFQSNSWKEHTVHIPELFSPPPVYSSQSRGTYRTYPGIVLTSTSLLARHATTTTTV